MERPAEFLLNQGFCGYHHGHVDDCDEKPPQQIIVYNQDCYWQCFVYVADEDRKLQDIVVWTKVLPQMGH